MSRIGNKVVVLPAGVEIKQDGNNITVKGPKGELTREFSSDIKMNIEGNEVTFIRPNDSKEMKTIHGTTRANFNNMVVGVSEGFQKALELIGVGYRAQVQGNKLTLNVGYSHPVEMTAPEGVTFEVPANTQVIVKGINKEAVSYTHL
ncbi:50S ribosomal protein L6, partial [Enterococcus sp. S157_ASV_20]|nr:50S ribosomal protein L6 [Enterococcus sp. S157_ASV_20]